MCSIPFLNVLIGVVLFYSVSTCTIRFWSVLIVIDLVIGFYLYVSVSMWSVPRWSALFDVDRFYSVLICTVWCHLWYFRFWYLLFSFNLYDSKSMCSIPSVLICTDWRCSVLFGFDLYWCTLISSIRFWSVLCGFGLYYAVLICTDRRWSLLSGRDCTIRFGLYW